MPVSFGSYIPTKVYVDKKEVKGKNSQQQIDDVTNCLASVLSKQNKSDYLSEQQRRMFNAVVDDYHIVSKEDDEKAIPKAIAETIGEKRYIITGKDKDFFALDIFAKSNPAVAICCDKQAKEKAQKYMLATAAKNRFEKTLNILAITNPKATNKEDKYKIALIDFVG